MLEIKIVAQNGTFQLETIIDDFQWNVILDPGVFKPEMDN
jgi:hypothetical protein